MDPETERIDVAGKDGSEDVLTAAAGRTVDGAELKRRIAHAPAAFLTGSLDNPALDESCLVLLLRNREVAPPLLERISRDPRWARLYEVRKGLVRHPRAPLQLARRLVHHLRWRDLAEVAAEAPVHPAVRRQAEELLKVRMAELALGERISLARIASRGLIQALRHSAEGPVLEALLGNSRLVELDAVTIARGEKAPAAVLRKLAAHPTWGRRHAVRLALVTNPRAPVAVALGVLRRLSRQDLRRLAKDSRVPKIVRVGADRRLEGRAAGPARLA